MNIVHIGWYNPKPTGGVGRAILEQTKALLAEGHQIEIWNFTPSVKEPKLMQSSAPFPVWQLPMHQNKILRCIYLKKRSKKWISNRLNEVDLFHIHSVFIPENANIAKLGKPYVLTPNGGWSDVVLNGKRKWTKRFWIMAIEQRMWSSASAIQAVSRQEAIQLANRRGMARIEVIPNGTEIPDEVSNLKDRDCFLYIGRLDLHQKGLDILFESLKIVRQKNATIPKVILAGPDYRGGKAQLQAYSDRNQLSDVVEIMGTVQGVDKDALFRRARLFIHTSRWEGLPLVLLEALSYGIPCLLTPGTNVASEWAAAGCAFETSQDPNEIANHLIRLSNLPLVNESQSARALAKSEYLWASIGKKISSLYSSIITSS